MTAHSATAECPSRTRSISAGYTFNPPEMIISLDRPAMYRYPSSSTQPRSPVRNQPSVNAAWVSFGLFQYPCIVAADRHTISPWTPGSASTPTSSMTRSRASPTALPTDPALLRAISAPSAVITVGNSDWPKACSSCNSGSALCSLSSSSTETGSPPTSTVRSLPRLCRVTAPEAKIPRSTTGTISIAVTPAASTVAHTSSGSNARLG